MEMQDIGGAGGADDHDLLPMNESLGGDHDTSVEPLNMNNMVVPSGNGPSPIRNSGKKSFNLQSSVRDAK